MPRYRIRSVHKFRECNARRFTRQTGTCTVKPKTHNFHFPPRNCRVISLANKERRPGVRVSCYSINYSINYRARLACTGIRGDLKSSWEGSPASPGTGSLGLNPYGDRNRIESKLKSRILGWNVLSTKISTTKILFFSSFKVRSKFSTLVNIRLEIVIFKAYRVNVSRGGSRVGASWRGSMKERVR